MKKIFKALAVIGVSAALCAPLAACGDDTAKTEQEKIYDAYVVYAEAAGEEPLSYEEWLESVQGEKGEKGDKGDQGVGISDITYSYGYNAESDYFYTEITFKLSNDETKVVIVPSAMNPEATYEASDAETLQKFMEAGVEKIVLGADIETDLTVEEGQTLALDLNGYTLTNESSHTIYNSGTLTVSDTVGGGVVDNVTHEKAAIHNDVGAKAVLNGGTFMRSKENGQNSTSSGGNSFYAIRNYGTMTINDGVTVSQNGHYSSLLENGWYSGAENSTKAASVLVINGGHFMGGLNTIKNDDWGNLTIKGGTFENVSQAVVLNWNVAAIEGGTFLASNEAQAIILNGYADAEMDKGELTIGEAVNYEGAKLLYPMNNNFSTLGTIKVVGEEMKNAVVESLGDDKVTVTENEGGYTIKAKA